MHRLEAEQTRQFLVINQPRQPFSSGVFEVAGAAAHHLSQPIQVLLSGANYLQRGKFDGFVREMTDVMLEAVARLKERIDRIQAITRYENEAYVQGKRIVDVIKYSADKP